MATTSAPWTFEQEGNYSENRMGAAAAFGHLRLDVQPRVLRVRMVSGETGDDVGGYSVAPHSHGAESSGAGH